MYVNSIMQFETRMTSLNCSETWRNLWQSYLASHDPHRYRLIDTGMVRAARMDCCGPGLSHDILLPGRRYSDPAQKRSGPGLGVSSDDCGRGARPLGSQ